MAYIEVKFSGITQEISEILIALLAEKQYHGFEEYESGLRAFVSLAAYDKNDIAQLADSLQLSYSVAEIQDTNWNTVWESNFQPVIVDDFCIIRADFHEPVKNITHEIIITPKMSFGTGHHPTTYMMIGQMRELDITGRSVLDFGTGTGVLAILAVMLGASAVTAIDNDEWSISNAKENFERNNVAVELHMADSIAGDDQFDIILANITRNVIIENFPGLSGALKQNGTLVLSGLLSEDEEDITHHAHSYGFGMERKMQRDNWISLMFRKNKPAAGGA